MNTLTPVKRKIIFSLYGSILVYTLLIPVYIIGNKPAFYLYLLIAVLLASVARPFISDRKYLVSFTIVANGIYIEYMTALFKTRSVELDLLDFVKIEKTKLHWITRQPSAMLLSFNKGQVEFYLADKAIFDEVSAKLSDAKMGP